MRLPAFDANWPVSWRESHVYDRLELSAERRRDGYTLAYRTRVDETMRLISSCVPVGSTILDLAAAQGNFSLRLAEQGYRVTWNDLREDLAGYVRLKYERGPLEFAAGNAFDLRFAEPFDAVLATEVIEHVAHPDRFLKRVAELVRDGGRVIVTTPNGGYFRNRHPKWSTYPDPSRFEASQFRPNADGHIFLLWPSELPELAAQAGLEIERVVTFTTPLTAGHLGTGALLARSHPAIVRGIEKLSRRLPRMIRESVHVQLGVTFRRPIRSGSFNGGTPRC